MSLERRVSGVAVTRHAVVIVSSTQVRTADIDGKLDGPAVTVEFPCQIVLNDPTPPFREFLLNRLTPLDDRDDVGVVVRLKQRETFVVVESTIKVDGLDLGVKAVENTEELGEDAAGGVAVFETAHRQRVSIVLHACVERGVRVKRSGTSLRFRMVEAVCVVFVTVVGSQEEVENRVRRWRVFTGVAERRDQGSVSGCADEDLVDVLWLGFSVVGKVERNFLVKSIDEEIKELVLVDFTVCLLLVLGHIFSKQTFLLTGFVRY